MRNGASITIKELATRLGLSTATVSRAFTPGARISDATRSRILAEAEALGFSPNSNARRLAQQRSGLIGLDCPGNFNILDNLFLVELARGIQAAASSSGYGLLLNTLPRDGGDVTLLREWVHGRVVDGVVLVLPPGFPMDTLKLLAGRDVPCVVIAQNDEEATPLRRVTLDLEHGALAALRHLRLLGHRRIGFLSSNPPDSVHTAYSDFMKADNLFDRSLIAYTEASVASARNAMHQLLAVSDRPTALFARNDVIALGALRAVREMGLSVPRDISVIGHDDIVLASLTDPALTTVRVDTERLGRIATEMLLEAMQPNGANAEADQERKVQTELIVRDSTAPIAHAVVTTHTGENVLA